MDRVYIVVGSTGTYEDRTEWFVKAFSDEMSAESFRRLCQKYVTDLLDVEQYEAYSEDLYKALHKAIYKADGDPARPDVGTKFSSTGTSYDVVEVEFEGEC